MLRRACCRFAVPPPVGLTYNPPADQNDFNKTESYFGWQSLVKQQLFNDSIWNPTSAEGYYGGIAYRLPDPKSLAENFKNFDTKSYLQFRETADIDAMAKKLGKAPVTQEISWNAFPRDLQGERNKYAAAELPWPGKADARRMDEYCEWLVEKDGDTITSITMTAEGPEYWQFLAETEPETALDLYRKYVSPEVQLKDLFKADGKTYDPYNPWNVTTDPNAKKRGLMHLNCPPNSLGAEAYIAAEASTRWASGSARSTPLTDAQALINCGQYGRATRNSDPHIGALVNTLIRSNLIVSISNPVGLYLKDLNLTGWQTPSGEDFDASWVHYERGSANRNIRIKVEVPKGTGFKLGDCTIGGAPILYGGQIVESSVTVFLVGYAVPGESFLAKPADDMPCVVCKDVTDAKGKWEGSLVEQKPLYPPEAAATNLKKAVRKHSRAKCEDEGACDN